MTMISKITKAVIAVWMVTMAFSTVAWADGAPTSPVVPVPAFWKYPLIKGTFTVCYRVFKDTPEYYDIHVVLKRFKTSKLYVISDRKVTSECKNICDYEKDFTMEQLIEKYEFDPRNLKVEKGFNLEGVPVITELKILGSSHCEDKHKAMLYGELKIRVFR